MSTPLSVLLIEDSEDDALLLIRELRRNGYEPDYRRVDTADGTREALREKPWDLVIADWHIPRFSGLEAFAIFRDLDLDSPFIVVSGTVGEDIAVEAMRAGVHDYVMKGNLRRLVPAIERELKDAETRRRHRRARRELQASEERFLLFMEHLPGAAFIKDQSGRIVYANGYCISRWIPERVDDLLNQGMGHFWSGRLDRTNNNLDESVLKSGRSAETVEHITLRDHTATYLTFKFPIPARKNGPFLGVISIDITKRQRAEDELREIKEQLEIEREALEKKNIALREILNQFEAEKEQTKEKIATNIEQAILPTLRRIKESAPRTLARNLALLEQELNEIASPFLHTLQHEIKKKLSPRETEICRLIRNGLTTKDIAEALNVAPATVQKHRETIRKKLGLARRKINLHSYLQSL